MSLYPTNCLILANSECHNEMSPSGTFKWVFTVCQSTSQLVSGTKRVKCKIILVMELTFYIVLCYLQSYPSISLRL